MKRRGEKQMKCPYCSKEVKVIEDCSQIGICPDSGEIYCLSSCSDYDPVAKIIPKPDEDMLNNLPF